MKACAFCKGSGKNFGLKAFDPNRNHVLADGPNPVPCIICDGTGLEPAEEVAEINSGLAIGRKKDPVTLESSIQGFDVEALTFPCCFVGKRESAKRWALQLARLRWPGLQHESFPERRFDHPLEVRSWTGRWLAGIAKEPGVVATGSPEIVGYFDIDAIWLFVGNGCRRLKDWPECGSVNKGSVDIDWLANLEEIEAWVEESLRLEKEGGSRE